jgi:hypothetical protein
MHARDVSRHERHLPALSLYGYCGYVQAGCQAHYGGVRHAKGRTRECQQRLEGWVVQQQAAATASSAAASLATRAGGAQTVQRGGHVGRFEDAAAVADQLAEEGAAGQGQGSAAAIPQPHDPKAPAYAQWLARVPAPHLEHMAGL